jgi:hypothetical protein
MLFHNPASYDCLFRNSARLLKIGIYILGGSGAKTAFI